ncbi:hypothetical protein PQQ52_20335 [Paraburkholderia sediminicola]|uniref:hypothetical protein n=1 Tax=Paraburkholderia sediminicola TaxID=458836 RepID=UPI0038BB2A50
MSSINLEALIDEFPEESESVERLAEFFDKAEKLGTQTKELTVQRFFDVAKPSSQGVLIKILQRLVQQGVLKKLIRVESDALGGIADFGSVTEVPAVLFDSRIGREIEVRSDQLKLVYRFESAGMAR